jgi:hypothetical protein
VDAATEEDGADHRNGRDGDRAVITLGDLDAIQSMDASDAARYLERPLDERRPGRYGSLTDVDVLDSKEVGARFFLAGDQLVLAYLSGDALADDVTADALSSRAGRPTERFRSRQGKRASLHVAAESGLAWSTLDDRIGWVEVFPPMTNETYLEQIYAEPPAFIQ